MRRTNARFRVPFNSAKRRRWARGGRDHVSADVRLYQPAVVEVDSSPVIPAKAGIHVRRMDSRFRGNDHSGSVISPSDIAGWPSRLPYDLLGSEPALPR